MPVECHADVVFSFAYLQLVCDPTWYLQNNILTLASPSFREYVILSDDSRKTYWCCLPVVPPPEHQWSGPTPAKQHVDTFFSFTHLQFVCDLIWYLWIVMLMLSLSAYRQYVILLDNCWWVCSSCLLCLPIGSAWCHPILAEQYAYPVFFLAGSRWFHPILTWQHVHTIWFGFLQRVCHLVWCL